MITRHIFVATVVILIVGIATVTVAQSPFVGTWKLNPGKSKLTGIAPLEWTDVIREIEGDRFEVTTIITLPDGSNINEVIVWPRYGGIATYPQDNVERLMDVMTTISSTEWIFTRLVDGKQTGFMNCNISQNNNIMHYTLRMPGLEGEAVLDKQ